MRPILVKSLNITVNLQYDSKYFYGLSNRGLVVSFSNFQIFKFSIYMPHYHKLGSIPHKRHTQFRKPDGTLYSEQLFSTEGFSSDSSLLYHTHPPTQIIKTDKPYSVMPEMAEEKMLQHRSFQGFDIKAG